MTLENLFDIHIHTSPDVRPRKLDDIEQATAARNAAARGFVLKNHFSPTVCRAEILSQLFPELDIFGGIALNESVGGLNPASVDSALSMGGKIVWLPTLDAANHRVRYKQSGGISLLSANGELKDEVYEIIDLIADHDAALATGHISKEEIDAVLGIAVRRGLTRLVINHPEHRVTHLSITEQAHLLDRYPVAFERCHSHPLLNGVYQNNFAFNLEAIEALGHRSTVIASDLGQIENPDWTTGMTDYLGFLANHGVSDEAIRHMTQEAPATLFGLPELRENTSTRAVDP